MMTKNRSTKWMRTKVLLIVPALTAIVVVLSASTYFSEQPGKSNEMQISQSPASWVTQDKTAEKQIITSAPAAPQTQKEKKVYTVVDKEPSFPGGAGALKKFWEENIQYPEEAKKKNVTGDVFATFVVRSDGSVTDIKIIRGIGHGCDEELVRVIKLMPKWVPGEQKGEKVDVQFNLPVKFQLGDKPVPDKEKKSGKSGDPDKK
jgi:TonB family protein